ncbi:MAG: HD domain-containing protein [Saprospiraceae bacterium]|nr:HD domain-containing protein [Candidatus Kaiserbacteria bacterium]MCB0686235.1 HD domain-containing protein [Saprospiraceae bacterium]
MQINHSHIPNEVRNIAETLETAGFQAYLVGGCTRDLLLGRTPKDWDITTNATPEQIQALWPADDTFCNNDYGTVGVKTDSEEASVAVIEVTPYRKESDYSDARRPDRVEFGVSLEEDLARRDFTINSIAYRPATGELVDQFNGLADLAAGRLATVGNPDERFREDALRMMRAVRLSAQLDFMIESTTLASIAENHNILSRISIERIADEFSRLLMSDTPMPALVIMERLGLLQYVIPELEEGIGCVQGGAHAFDVFEHNLRTCQAAADKGYSLAMRYAAVLHDVAKPRTRGQGKHKEYSFYGHEVVGARMANKVLNRLKLPRQLIDEVVALVRWHMFFADPELITLSAVRRTITRIGEDNIENLLNLRVCDRIGTGRPKEQPFRFRQYKAMVDEALREPISVKLLKINGERLMELTGEKPGRKLGWLLHALLEEALDDASKNTVEYMEQRALELNQLPETELQTLAEAGKQKQAEEEAAALAEIARAHKVG